MITILSVASGLSAGAICKLQRTQQCIINLFFPQLSINAYKCNTKPNEATLKFKGHCCGFLYNENIQLTITENLDWFLHSSLDSLLHLGFLMQFLLCLILNSNFKYKWEQRKNCSSFLTIRILFCVEWPTTVSGILPSKIEPLAQNKGEKVPLFFHWWL